MDPDPHGDHPARHPRRGRILLLTLLLWTSPAHADLRIAIGNDVFTSVTPPIDDSGFTNDVDLRFWRPWRCHQLGGMLRHRWLTEVGGPRRWDEVELAVTLEHTWRWATVTARVGPVFGGNLGGRWMQNGWHSLTGTGPTLDEGLQHVYPGDRTFGAFAGARATRSLGTTFQAYGVLDAQLAAGAGVTYGEAAVGGRLLLRIGDVELGGHLEVADARYHVADERLALPGGYRPGWQEAWRIGLRIAWSRYVAEYEYRANEGGSGEPIGVIAFTIERR